MSVQKTVFNECHQEAGAKLIDFGGWHMPVRYTSQVSEHHCVRNQVGLFDVSHMGEVFIEGPKALDAIRYLVTNNVDLQDGQAQYTCMCNYDGGIVDDLIVYRFNQNKFMLCINAANRETDFQWMVNNNPFPEAATIENHSGQYAQVAVQGRFAEDTLQKLTSIPLSGISYYHFAVGGFCGIQDCIFARTGYTGEDGFEVFIPCSSENQSQTIGVWKKILNAGEDFGIQPIGLGARDTLRLEARMHLYGQDMSESVLPHEAGLFWTVDMNKPDFIGKKAIANHKENQWRRRLVAMTVEGKIPRTGSNILDNGESVGTITSGTQSPSLGFPIALGFVPRRLSRKDTTLNIDVRGRSATGTVISGAFYKRPY
ncbi:MAG: glycine cleavage system aminomethyltransferase GcvT [Myxococcota bacterium]|nr:glycine cleavage system aminomethyltransferase GcvT [Myxococcota bacterium]